MPTLLDKIEAEAAEALTLPERQRPGQELARYKQFLKRQAARLKMLHRAGGGGRELCQARAAVLDALHRRLLDAVLQSLPPEAVRQTRFALIAIGGYGRGELNPHSDLDIMFLHEGESMQVGRGKLPPLLDALLNPGGLLYTLYDINLKVGSSLRNLDDVVRIANTDMQTKTSLLEARLVAGNEALFKRMQAVLLARCIRGQEDAYIQERLADQAARRARFGNSACMQEPNIKNGCGGLRDYQNLLWMAYVKYRTLSLADLRARGLLNETERKQLDAAYDFLHRVRTELHYHCGRAMDALQRNLQPAVAYNLGYQDRAPVRRLERFMRDLYLHTRTIDLLTRTLEQRMALLPHPSRRLPWLRDLLHQGQLRMRYQVHDGFRMGRGFIQATTPGLFRAQPQRLMKAFLYAQQRALLLHPDLVHLLRSHLDLVDRSFRSDPHVRATFLEILGQRGTVAATLRSMHDVGFLGRYLPEFGRLTCLVQHEFFHRYTTDEHTLVCLEKLDQLWETKDPARQPYEELLRAVERPFVLYLALLLHDAGKARAGRSHAQAGGDLALRAARRLGLDANTIMPLRLLVEEHLLMVDISQRHDLDDPGVIESFVRRIPSLDTLHMLTLMSYADSLGTSEQLWNGFKDTCLWTLFHKARHRLLQGPEPEREVARERETLLADVRRLVPRTFRDDELEAHLASLPPRYAHIHNARQVAHHLSLVHRFLHRQIAERDQALEPVIDWIDEPDRGCARVLVCTWDRARLFSKIAGSLTAAGLNILGAQIFSRTDGIIIDSFDVLDARTGLIPSKSERHRFDEHLTAILTNRLDLPTLLARHPPARPLIPNPYGEQLPIRIRFDNDRSATRTVIDLECEDHVGLLHAISSVLAEQDLDLGVAKICTEKGAAADSFYVNEKDGRKVTSPERQLRIERQLRAALAALGQPQPRSPQGPPPPSLPA